jgi:hypothetical protein
MMNDVVVRLPPEYVRSKSNRETRLAMRGSHETD